MGKVLSNTIGNLFKGKQISDPDSMDALRDSNGYISQDQQEEAARRLTKRLGEIKNDYVGYVADNYDWKKPMDRSKKDALTRFLHFSMLSACTRPFMEDGLSISAIAQAYTMYWVMGAIAPDFKESARQMIGERLYPLAKASGNDKMQEVFGKMANGGRMPYDAESAVLQKIAMDKKFYEDSRQPDANVAELEEAYNKSIELIKDFAREDGISDEDFRRQEGITIRMLVQDDLLNGRTDTLKLYPEFAYSLVAPDAPVGKTEYVRNKDGSVDIVRDSVWMGGYHDAEGEPVESFRIRERLGDVSKNSDFVEEYRKTLAGQMLNGLPRYTDDSMIPVQYLYDMLDNKNVALTNDITRNILTEDGMSEKDADALMVNANMDSLMYAAQHGDVGKNATQLIYNFVEYTRTRPEYQQTAYVVSNQDNAFNEFKTYCESVGCDTTPGRYDHHHENTNESDTWAKRGPKTMSTLNLDDEDIIDGDFHEVDNEKGV